MMPHVCGGIGWTRLCDRLDSSLREPIAAATSFIPTHVAKHIQCSLTLKSGRRKQTRLRNRTRLCEVPATPKKASQQNTTRLYEVLRNKTRPYEVPRAFKKRRLSGSSRKLDDRVLVTKVLVKYLRNRTRLHEVPQNNCRYLTWTVLLNFY